MRYKLGLHQNKHAKNPRINTRIPSFSIEIDGRWKTRSSYRRSVIYVRTVSGRPHTSV